ncbi:MAG: hypothetical protein JXL97_14925 [Bacteroidales bacterium]|nr:hypothetical protein [Bacteroidales bacterium]
MKFIEVNNNFQKELFLQLPAKIYKNYMNYRTTNEETAEWLSFEKTEFHKHAKVTPYIIALKEEIIGRFTLIVDQNMPEYCQIAFLEFTENTPLNLSSLLKKFVTEKHLKCSKILIGLNGHLNYGAGILQNKFDKTPAFELPYTRNYYPEYFLEFDKKLVSTFFFKFDNLPENVKKYERFYPSNKFKIRHLNSDNFEEEIKIYTELNNGSFQKHLYWTNRTYKEDLELYAPFKKILTPDNLLIAEYNGNPIGFLLWLPDFNQLLKNNNEFLKFDKNLSHEEFKTKYITKIDTFRIMEIAIIPEFQRKRIDLMLFTELMRAISKTNYKYCEGGFILNENVDSMNMSQKYLKRLFDPKAEIHRQYAIYETNINT